MKSLLILLLVAMAARAADAQPTIEKDLDAQPATQQDADAPAEKKQDADAQSATQHVETPAEKKQDVDAQPAKKQDADARPEKQQARPQHAEDLFRPTTSGPFITFTAPITAPGRLVFQPIASVNFTEDPTLELQSNVFQLFMEYGLVRRFALGGQLQVNHVRARGDDVVSSVGVADSLLFGRGVLWFERGGSVIPEITAVVQLKLPTGRPPPGSPDALGTDITGTGTVDAAFGFDFTKGVRPFLFHLDVFATHAFRTLRDGVPYQYAPTLSWSFSGEWVYGRGRYALMMEVSGRHRGRARSGGDVVPESSEDEVAVGGGFELIASDDVQALFGVQRTVWSANVPRTTSFIVTVVPIL